MTDIRKHIAATILLGILTLPVRAQELRIPLTVSKCRVPVVEATISDISLILVLDTGSNLTSLGEHLRERIGPKYKSVWINIGSVASVKTPIRWFDVRAQTQACPEVDGVLGNDFFMLYKSVTFDFERGEMVLRK